MLGTEHQNCVLDIVAHHRLPQSADIFAEAPNHEELVPNDIDDHDMLLLSLALAYIYIIYNSQVSQHYLLFFLQISIH